jgi:hypothetical protein
MRADEVGEVLSNPLSQELLKRDVARLAFVAKDGTPRVIPIGMAPRSSCAPRRTPESSKRCSATRQ